MPKIPEQAGDVGRTCASWSTFPGGLVWGEAGSRVCLEAVVARGGRSPEWLRGHRAEVGVLAGQGWAAEGEEDLRMTPGACPGEPSGRFYCSLKTYIQTGEQDFQTRNWSALEKLCLRCLRTPRWRQVPNRKLNAVSLSSRQTSRHRSPVWKSWEVSDPQNYQKLTVQAQDECRRWRGEPQENSIM